MRGVTLRSLGESDLFYFTQVDVVVNVCSPGLDLRIGHISHAILEAAGGDLQGECTQKYPRGISYGQVAITSAGRLPCKSVFHGPLTKWDQGHGYAVTVSVGFL